MGIIGLWMALSQRMDKRFDLHVRKDVLAEQHKRTDETLTRIEQKVDGLVGNFPTAIKDACVAGFAAGAELMRREG